MEIVFGFLLVKLPMKESHAKWVSRLALAGLLMPLGILAGVYTGLPFYTVLVEGLLIFLATVWLGAAVVQIKINSNEDWGWIRLVDHSQGCC